MARLLVILLGLYENQRDLENVPFGHFEPKANFSFETPNIETKKVRDSAECPQCVVWKRAGKPEAGVVVEEVELAREPNDIDSEPELW